MALIKSTSKTPKKSFRLNQLVTFFITWLSYAAYYLTRKNFSVVKSTLKEQLGVSVIHLGYIDTIYLALYSVGQFINGGLGDKFGPKKIIFVGMVCSALCSCLFGLSNGFLLFALFFGLNGYFQSTGWPNNVKAMTPWFTDRQRGKVMGLWCTNYQVGGLAATALASFLLQQYGWRSTFLTPATLVAVVALMVLIFLKEKPSDLDAENIDTRENSLPDSAQTIEESSNQSIFSMLKIPALLSFGLSYFGLKLIRYSLLFWLPFYLNTVLGYPRHTAGYMSISFEIGGIFGAIFTGWLSDNYFSHNRVRLLVPMLLGLALALFIYPQVGNLSPMANILSMALVGMLLVGPDSLISGACAQDIGGNLKAASVAGIINGIGSVGAICQGMVTAFISRKWGWNFLFYFFVLVATFSSLVLLPLALKSKLKKETS